MFVLEQSFESCLYTCRHVVFAPSSVNSYGSSLFPGISDTIFEATQSGKEEDWNKVRRQIDIVRNHLRYATMIINEPCSVYNLGS